MIFCLVLGFVLAGILAPVHEYILCKLCFRHMHTAFKFNGHRLVY